MSWSFGSYNLSAPSFLSCSCRDCVVDVSFGAGYPTISCSLHFDKLRLPILVSVCCEKKFFFGEGRERHLAVDIRISI